MFKRICKITFITHGATVYSLDGIVYDGLKSPKINDLGEEEVESICQHLESRGVQYDRIYSSPYAYCTQTAQIIAKLFHQKVVSTNLKNRNHGDWQGQSLSDIIKENGIKTLIETPNNGESLVDFNKRVAEFIEQIIQENKGNRVIIVTTPEIVQSALAYTLQLSLENQFKMLIKTGSLTQISYFDGWSSVIYADYKSFS